jgi:hypothetical protein
VSDALAEEHVSTPGEAVIPNVPALTPSLCTFAATPGSEVVPALNPSAAP